MFVGRKLIARAKRGRELAPAAKLLHSLGDIQRLLRPTKLTIKNHGFVPGLLRNSSSALLPIQLSK